MTMIRKHRSTQLVIAAVIGAAAVVTPAIAGPTVAETVPAVAAVVPTAHATTGGYSSTVWKCWPASTRYRGSGCGWYRHRYSLDVEPARYMHEHILTWSRIVGVGPTYVQREITHSSSW